MPVPVMLTVAEIREGLSSGVRKFKFNKGDGTERTVYGTLDIGVITRLSSEDLSGVQKKVCHANDDKIMYFDVSKRSWGSFKVQSFIRFEEYGD